MSMWHIYLALSQQVNQINKKVETILTVKWAGFYDTPDTTYTWQYH